MRGWNICIWNNSSKIIKEFLKLVYLLKHCTPTLPSALAGFKNWFPKRSHKLSNDWRCLFWNLLTSIAVNILQSCSIPYSTYKSNFNWLLKPRQGCWDLWPFIFSRKARATLFIQYIQHLPGSIEAGQYFNFTFNAHILFSKHYPRCRQRMSLLGVLCPGPLD